MPARAELRALALQQLRPLKTAVRGMAQKKIGSLAKKEGRVGDHLPYLAHANDVTLALNDGMLMQVILLDGFPFETADTDELNYRQAVRDTMLRSVGNARIALYHHILRRRTTVDLAASFEDPFSRWLDQRWRRRIGEKKLYVNDLFLTVIYRPSIGKVGVLDRLGDRARRLSRDARLARERDIRTLDGVREGLLASLKPYGPRTLGRYDGPGGRCSEPLEFLSLLLNGELNPVIEPSGPAAHHLPYKRLSFGVEAMEFKGAGASGFGAMLSLKEYPATATPGMLDALLRLPIDMVVTESFSFVDRQIAQERIDLSLRRLRAADEPKRVEPAQRAGLARSSTRPARNTLAEGDSVFRVTD